MGIKHAVTKVAGQKVFAVADWNTDHVVDSDINIGAYSFEANKVTAVTFTDGHATITGGAITGASGSNSQWTNDEGYITSANPAGADTQVQYNNSGNFGADAGFTTDKAGSLTLTGTGTAGRLVANAVNGIRLNTHAEITDKNTLTSNVLTVKHSWTSSSSGAFPIIAVGCAFTDDRTVIGGIPIDNVMSISAGITKTGTYDTTTVNQRGFQNSVSDYGDYNKATAQTLNTYAGWTGQVSQYEITGGQTLTANEYGQYITQSGNPTITSGALIKNSYGVGLHGVGTTIGTSTGYGFYDERTGYDTNWCLYNAGNGNNYLGADNITNTLGSVGTFYSDGTDIIQTSTRDIFLNATGNVKFGTHAAITTETLSGFITIKDAAGNTRKLAVVS